MTPKAQYSSSNYRERPSDYRGKRRAAVAPCISHGQEVNCPAHGGAGLVSELGLYQLWLVGRGKSPVRRHRS